jgi:hypothetical protein
VSWVAGRRRDALQCLDREVDFTFCPVMASSSLRKVFWNLSVAVISSPSTLLVSNSAKKREGRAKR